MLGRINRYLNMRNGDWLPHDRLAALQLRRLKRIIDHAYRTVPFYRELWDRHGFQPGGLRTLEDIVRIPRITKRMVKTAGGAILSERSDPRKLISDKTSGSTGEPWVLHRDKAFQDVVVASKLRTFLANGFSPFDKVVLWLSVPTTPKPYHRLGLLREYGIPKTMPLPEQAAVLRKLKAGVFLADPTPLAELARFAQREGIALFRPRIIFTYSENMSDEVRSLIHRHFGTEPLDIYSSREFGFVAWECGARAGYHQNADLLMVEILNPKTGERAGEGESGRVIVTNFFNDASPLIRYDTGDIAVFTDRPCTCGRPLPIIRNLEGRDCDYLVLPSGRLVSGPMYATNALKRFAEIERYQLILEPDGLLEVRLKMEPGQSVDEEEVVRSVEGKFPGLRVSLRYVDRFARDEGEKFRVFVNRYAGPPESS